jgi:hypothetical protein
MESGHTRLKGCHLFHDLVAVSFALSLARLRSLGFCGQRRIALVSITLARSRLLA